MGRITRDYDVVPPVKRIVKDDLFGEPPAEGLNPHYSYHFDSCLLPDAYCLLPIACCLLPIAYCLLPIAYCLLPVAYCLLPVAYFAYFALLQMLHHRIFFSFIKPT